jgi:ParB family chromosome partitioning protein
MAKKSTAVKITGFDRREQGKEPNFAGLVSEDGQFKEIPIARISPDPNQPRRFFDEEKLNELAESVRHHGVIQPIIVKPDPENHRYILIAGERRYRASIIAGRTTIPALVKEKEDPLELGIIENLQREDLKPLEESQAMLRLKEEKNYTDEEIAKILGMSRPNVNISLALNRLPEQIKTECQNSDNVTKSLLYQIVAGKNEHGKTKTEEDMIKLWERYQRGATSLTREKKNKTKSKEKNTRARPFEYYQKYDTYTVTVRFKKSTADTKEIITILQQEVERLRSELNDTLTKTS